MRHIDLSGLRRSVSNEDVLNHTVNEVELTIYAEVCNIDQVEACATERKRMEQWDIPTDTDKGRMRIRKIDDMQMLLTSKTFRPGVIGALEHSSVITKGQFENIRRMSENGHYKTRLVIPFTQHPHIWEVDLYYRAGGALSNWVKIDLEEFDIHREIPEELPFDCKRIILSDDPNISEADKRQIAQLWDEEWVKIEG